MNPSDLIEAIECRDKLLSMFTKEEIKILCNAMSNYAFIRKDDTDTETTKLHGKLLNGLRSDDGTILLKYTGPYTKSWYDTNRWNNN